jgi:hypothetical protein
MMDRGDYAVRQFHRMLPGVARQDHLRATDPRRYREHVASLTPPEVHEGNSRLVGEVVYDSAAQTVTFRRTEDPDK